MYRGSRHDHAVDRAHEFCGAGVLAGRIRRRPERSPRPICSREHLEALDEELARRASDAGRLRFEIGWGLDLLERSGGDHELGFSSIEAYALERCERSASWTQKARGLARRLERLPALTDALVCGSLSWSMAAVLATVAQPDDAHFWLAEATRRTVREMKALVLERRGAVDEGEHLEADEEMRTLTITVPREDAWCFEHAKLLGRHLGVRRVEELERAVIAGQMSAVPEPAPLTAPPANVTLRLRVRASTGAISDTGKPSICATAALCCETRHSCASPASSPSTPGDPVAPRGPTRTSTNAIATAARVPAAAVATSPRITCGFARTAATTPTRT